GLADLPLGPDQPLRHGRLGDQERGRDLGRGQPAHRAQRQPHPGRRVQRGGAAGEDQRKLVVGARRPPASRVRRGATRSPPPPAPRSPSPPPPPPPRPRSSPLCRPAPTTQPRGLPGGPPAGHRAKAAAQASCTASSAPSRSPTWPATAATAAHQWARNTSPSAPLSG